MAREEFVEVESGKNNDRAGLAKAMSLCRLRQEKLPAVPPMAQPCVIPPGLISGSGGAPRPAGHQKNFLEALFGGG